MNKLQYGIELKPVKLFYITSFTWLKLILVVWLSAKSNFFATAKPPKINACFKSG